MFLLIPRVQLNYKTVNMKTLEFITARGKENNLATKWNLFNSHVYEKKERAKTKKELKKDLGSSG